MNKNQSITAKKALGLIANETFGHKKSELPRFECFHNGIILIVICFHCLAFFAVKNQVNTALL